MLLYRTIDLIMADLQSQNEALQQEISRLKREAQLQKQNEALQKEIEQLKKGAGAPGKLHSLMIIAVDPQQVLVEQSIH